MMACSIRRIKSVGAGMEEGVGNGLIAMHAYSVLGLLEHAGERLVRLRNPHGMGEWKGAFAPGAAEWESCSAERASKAKQIELATEEETGEAGRENGTFSILAHTQIEHTKSNSQGKCKCKKNKK